MSYPTHCLCKTFCQSSHTFSARSLQTKSSCAPRLGHTLSESSTEMCSCRRYKSKGTLLLLLYNATKLLAVSFVAVLGSEVCLTGCSVASPRLSSGFFDDQLHSNLRNDIDASVSICRYASLTLSIALHLFCLTMLASTRVKNSCAPFAEFLNQ